MKKVFSVRVSPELVKKAQETGVNISAIVEQALETLVKEKKCPICGQKIKK